MRATVLLAVSLIACHKKTTELSTQAAPVPVKVATVTAAEAPTPEILTLTGRIAADQRSDVTADTQGKVVGVMIERGQRVKMGEAVVRLDVRTAALSAREAQANLATARAQKQLAEEECKRAQTLLDKGAITRSEYDRQMTQCTSALQQVSAAEARTEMISKSVADGLVRAPFDGVVAEKFVSPGEWVAPGKPLFTLVDDDPLRIELSVPEVVVRTIKLGQKVMISAVAQPDKTYVATVSRIGAEIGRSRSLIVEATIDKAPTPTPAPATGSSTATRPVEVVRATDNGTDLVPGMFAEAHVTIGQTPRPVLPEAAVAKRGKTWHAFVVLDGELQDRIVQLGQPPGPGTVSIVRGVITGEQVVAKVTDQTIDGLHVQ